jgi:hypothetical protein
VASSDEFAPPLAVALDVPDGSGSGVQTDAQPVDAVHGRFFVDADESS